MAIFRTNLMVKGTRKLNLVSIERVSFTEYSSQISSLYGPKVTAKVEFFFFSFFVTDSLPDRHTNRHK